MSSDLKNIYIMKLLRSKQPVFFTELPVSRLQRSVKSNMSAQNFRLVIKLQNSLISITHVLVYTNDTNRVEIDG